MRVRRIAATVVLIATSPTPGMAESPIEHGAYIAAVAGCDDCHTPRKPGARILSGGTTFGKGPNAAISANLTPDRETGIGGWSDMQIAAAIRDGLRPDGTKIGPPMPQRAYHGLTQSDVAALVAYLKSVPAVHNDVRLPGRRTSARPGSADAPDAPAYAERGAYLFGAVAHCADCHGPVGEKQAAAPRVFASAAGPVTAPHLTKALLAGYSDSALAAVVTRGVRIDGSKLNGPMPTTAYARLTSEDLAALLAYLRSAKTETR